MAYQPVHRDLEEPGFEAKVGNLHPSARGTLQLADNPALQRTLKPTAAHDKQRGKRHDQQVFNQDQDEANRFGNFPARKPTSPSLE